MATKAKSEPVPKPAPVPAPAQQSPLAPAYTKALKLMETSKYAEAVKALQAVVQQAQDTGDWAVKRRAQVYLSLAEAKAHPAKAGVTDPVSEIQACLNHRDSAEALKQVEKALKSHPAHASLHYLRSVAFAQTENVEGAAESLKKALELDSDLVFQWHMEPDFNPIRKSPLFAFTEGR